MLCAGSAILLAVVLFYVAHPKRDGVAAER
jgi:hypothetical protein